jgi:hypothetical protein
MGTFAPDSVADLAALDPCEYPIGHRLYRFMATLILDPLGPPLVYTILYLYVPTGIPLNEVGTEVPKKDTGCPVRLSVP